MIARAAIRYLAKGQYRKKIPPRNRKYVAEYGNKALAYQKTLHSIEISI
jgi:hypothetical protein